MQDGIKGKGRKGMLPAILLVVDLLLLAVIIVSCVTGKDREEPAAAEAVQTETTPESVSPESVPPESVPENREEAVSPAVPETPPTEEAVYDTHDRPSTGDFLEWYTQDVMWNGVPAGTEPIQGFEQVTGTWKGLIYYDPENTHASEAIELLNFTVGGTESALTLTADWYSIYWVQDGQGTSEEDMEDLTFNGHWENGSLYATGAAAIQITDFYTQNGKQYAAGTMDCSDGTPAKVAMVRP